MSIIFRKSQALPAKTLQLSSHPSLPQASHQTTDLSQTQSKVGSPCQPPPPSQQQSAVFHDGLPQGSEYRSDRRRPGSAAGPNGKGGRLLVRISREGPVRLHRYRRRRAACEGAFKVRKGEEEVEALPCTPSGLTCCCNAVVASRVFRGRSG